METNSAASTFYSLSAQSKCMSQVMATLLASYPFSFCSLENRI